MYIHAAFRYTLKQRLEVSAFALECCSCILLQQLRRLDYLRHQPRVGGPERGGAAQQIVRHGEQARAPLQRIELRDRNSTEAEMAAPHGADSSSDGPPRCPCNNSREKQMDTRSLRPIRTHRIAEPSAAAQASTCCRPRTR